MSIVTFAVMGFAGLVVALPLAWAGPARPAGGRPAAVPAVRLRPDGPSARRRGRCAECGADLKRPGALRVGHRRRLRIPLASAAAVGLASVGLLGWAGHRTLEEVDWQRHRPARWLLDDLASADTIKANAAGDELRRRYDERSLPAQFVQPLIAAALGRLDSPRWKRLR